MWIVLTPSGGTLSRTRSPYRGEKVHLTRSLGAEDSAAICAELERLGAWRLSHFKQPVRDGWPCAIALADGERTHSIQTHNPEGEHLRLIEYILGLLPLPPNENQIRLLCQMMHHAFLELRVLGWRGQAEQAADLADAFHNLPVVMFSRDFNWSWFKQSLEAYQNRYQTHLDYVAMLENIMQERDLFAE
jgi:hypothetical protein